MIIKKFTRKNLKKIPLSVAMLLTGIRDYSYKTSHRIPPDHKKITREMNKNEEKPYTIIIIAELLDDSHWNDKRYVNITREKNISELDEVVSRYFWRELNERMSKYLEHNKDPEDKHLNKLIKEYYPRAKRILREQYKENYPRSWKKKFSIKTITTPRTEIRRERKYNIPNPLDFWDSRNVYQQYFIIPERKFICKGGSGGSGQRETQSVYGFAFAEYNKVKAIPSYLFIYTKDNELKFIDKVRGICLVPNDMGSNYDIDIKVRDKLMKKVFKVRFSDPLRRINNIEIYK